MNILVLAAANQNISDGDYPVCLTEFDGVPLIEHIISACAPLAPQSIIFALRSQDIQKYHLDNVIHILAANAKVVPVHDTTLGAACTALLAVDWIDNDEELLILSANEIIDADFGQIISSFRNRKLDAGVVIFPSVHPRYSYVRLDAEGFVVEVAEKNPISRHATASFYWFSQGRSFVRAAKNMIRKDAHIGDLFYICPTLNELVLEQKQIAAHPIDVHQYHPLKSEKQMLQYETAQPLVKT